MSKNKTFFKNVKEGKMSLGDIFADVTSRHAPEQTAKVLTAGTVLTTPDEKFMLVDWQRPFLFARFFVGYLGILLLAFAMGSLLGYAGGYYLLLVAIPFLVPVTLLLLVWEMNVPRNISLYEVISITALGGVISILVAVLMNLYSDNYMAAWAGLIEEPAKLLVIYIILRKKNYRYAINGALIGVAVGTGFAVMESLIYVISSMGECAMAVLDSCLADGMTLKGVLDDFGSVWFISVSNGLNVAIARAVTALSGHGVFAALYGSALVKAKGKEEIRISHLFKPEFLAYFAIAILLHALHNYGLDLGLPSLLDGLLPCEYIIIAAVAVGLLLNVLTIGVNQVVSIAMSHNDDHLTVAMNPKAGGPKAAPAVSGPARDIKLQCLAGPSKGQKYRCKEGQSFTIGRDPEKNAIVMTGYDHVSAVHCRIEITGGRIFITDLTSRNGTYLDDQRLSPNQPMSALNGSIIALGDESCSFQVHVQ